jgi:DNA-binding NarL/FixJ family response regulator
MHSLNSATFENMIPLALVEDDDKIRRYLSALIETSDKFLLQCSFATAEEAIAYFQTKASVDIKLVLTDLELPGKSGIELISWLKNVQPSVQLMVLSAYDDPERVFGALKAGASGYVLKNTPSHKLLEALHDLHLGGSPMTSQIARMVVSAFQQPIQKDDPKEVLSMREHEVLHWLAQGYRYKEIADKLFISIETVRTHIRNIYEKLHARNRMEALRKAGLR